MFITTNILQRTFRIRYGEHTGTCFTIDVDNKQYIVTARHVVPSISGPTNTVQIYHDSAWKTLRVDLVGHGQKNIDITTLAPHIQLSPTHRLPASIDGVTIGQDVRFLGFPYGLITDVGNINRDFPLPLVKQGLISSLQFDEEKILLLDGHNNPGFSGGPVVCQMMNNRKRKNELTVIGVVSGYIQARDSIYAGEAETPLKYNYNTGMVKVVGIVHALNLIESNPIGFNIISATK